MSGTLTSTGEVGGGYVPRPALAFRVGVTASRELSDGAETQLSGLIARALTALRDEIVQIGREDIAASSYRTDIAPRLRLLSPLAEGGDRLVAETALALDYSLEALLPFVQDEYEADFPATVDAFRGLLARASHVLELDGSHDEDHKNRSYEAVGRHVVRNADLLIAIWDGHPAKGRGGTGDIVRFAIRVGVPIWWIPDNGTERPRLLRTMSELRQPRHAPAGEEAEQKLRELLARAVLPPAASPPHTHTAISRVVGRCYRLLYRRATPLSDYLREDPPAPTRIWRTYEWFMDRLAPRSNEARVEMLAPEGPVEAYWHDLYLPADALSQTYGARYRSSYILIFTLAFVAVICAVVSLAFHRTGAVLTAVELLALTTITVLVIGNHFRRWHERWIAYRLLAELCRKQQTLAPLGWSLPNWEVDRLAAEGPEEPDGGSLPRGAWAAWYFTAGRRAAPLPEGKFTGPALVRPRDLGVSLLSEQQNYHQVRHDRSTKAANRLGNLGEWFFIVTLIGVAAKFLLLWTDGPFWEVQALALTCALLPAAAAAFIGIRTYAEFELLAHQSARMEATMQTASADVGKIELDRPLASQDLGEVLYLLMLLMLQDIAGWSQLFRLKILETT